MREIPIDNSLTEFAAYLQKNDRIIFSAAFGDGKSYFIDAFMRKRKDEYLFLTLHPVNYQVASNSDVFELIKYDILVQLLASGLGEEVVPISEELYAIGYLQENAGRVVTDLVGLCAPVLNAVVPFSGAALKGVMALNERWRKGYADYKQKIQGESVEARIETYINAFADGKGMIYEYDFITALISSLVEQYKQENEGKQVVLVIEDLDRLDPAHIFRLLNIFSAHTDRCRYALREAEQTKLTPNKFGFDKIVLVCDIYNIARIFHHFYGSSTSFEGYIQKFSTSRPYVYSLSTTLFDFMAGELHQMCPFGKAELSETLEAIYGDINNGRDNDAQRINIRQVEYYLTDIERDIEEQEIRFSPDREISAKDSALLKLLVVFKRMGLRGNAKLYKYVDQMVSAYKKDQIAIFAPYVEASKGESCEVMCMDVQSVYYKRVTLGEYGDNDKVMRRKVERIIRCDTTDGIRDDVHTVVDYLFKMIK